jgi:hypothetical protein
MALVGSRCAWRVMDEIVRKARIENVNRARKEERVSMKMKNLNENGYLIKIAAS